MKKINLKQLFFLVLLFLSIIDIIYIYINIDRIHSSRRMTMKLRRQCCLKYKNKTNKIILDEK